MMNSLDKLISFFAPYLISIFNAEPDVILIGTQYLWIAPVAFSFIGLLMISSTVLNVLHRPIKSGVMSVLQMFIIYIPLGWALTLVFDLIGIFIAYVVSYLIVGIISMVITLKEIKTQGIGNERK